jgi:hypothetical protein
VQIVRSTVYDLKLCRPYRPGVVFGRWSPGPALVGLALAQAIKFRAFSPDLSPPAVSLIPEDGREGLIKSFYKPPRPVHLVANRFHPGFEALTVFSTNCRNAFATRAMGGAH